jgi:hypothetical protein
MISVEFSTLKYRHSTKTTLSPSEREMINDWWLNGEAPAHISSKELLSMYASVDTSYVLEGEDAEIFEEKMLTLYENNLIDIETLDRLLEGCVYHDRH